MKFFLINPLLLSRMYHKHVCWFLTNLLYVFDIYVSQSFLFAWKEQRISSWFSFVYSIHLQQHFWRLQAAYLSLKVWRQTILCFVTLFLVSFRFDLIILHLIHNVLILFMLIHPFIAHSNSNVTRWLLRHM